MKKILLTFLICLFSISAMSQNSNQNVNDEVQRAIKIRRDIDANSANNKMPTNFLIGMCIMNIGNSRCNLNEANRNLTTKLTTGEAWGYFVENNSRNESYGLGRNGQMSTVYVSPLQPLRYKILDNNDVEVIHVGRNGCDVTYQYSKINKNTVSRLATNITSNCDEVMNSIFESNSKKWSEPQRMYPLANRFPELTSSSSPQSQSQPPKPQANNQPPTQSPLPQTQVKTLQYTGGIFVGETLNDIPNGKGEFTGKNGSFYLGQFKNGKFHGQGSYTYPTGNKYIGNWDNGVKSGVGQFIFTDGASHSGEFKNDLRNGFGTYISKSGTKTVGTFKDDKYVGP